MNPGGDQSKNNLKVNPKLVLMRHGESEWNLQNRFTGWTDVNLTNNGENEAKKAGQLLLDGGFDIHKIYASFLKRSINTAKICLKILNKENLGLVYDWRLNERHYGNLQGLNKASTSKKYGDKQVLIWRRSYDVSPPRMKESDLRHPKNDKLYKNIDFKNLPCGESLKDTLERVKPLWINEIIPQIKKGKNLMIVAHGNSLRAIVKMLKNISNKEIVKLNIPTGSPYIFEFNNKFELIKDFYLVNEKEI